METSITQSSAVRDDTLVSEFVFNKGFMYRFNDEWTYDAVHDGLEAIGNLIFKNLYRGGQTYIYAEEDRLVEIRDILDRRKITVSVYLQESEDTKANEIFEILKKHWVPTPESKDDEIELGFWYNTQTGPSEFRRKISVPSWDEISDNYTEKTLENLNVLMDSKYTPAHGGQLVLWRGIPGSGKTYALRAMCRQWKEWCSFDYIVDADRFFSADSGYLMQIISSQEYEWDDEGNPLPKKEWKLLILEDAGELLAVEAREKVGQALSRLLNLVDGLIGQGLKVLVLITTNEELEKLHPAVSRPGRTASIVKFEEFTRAESKKWAEKRGFTLPEPGQYSLAELFSLWENYDNKANIPSEHALGFRMMANG